MNIPCSVSLSRPILANPTSPRGSSGILISKKYVLTHGTALLSIPEVTELLDLISEAKPGEIVIPREPRRELRFLTLREDTRKDHEENGHVAAVWKCPLLLETFDKFFEAHWRFDQTRFGRLLLPVFLLLRLGPDEDRGLEIPWIRRLLLDFVEGISWRRIVKGDSLEVVSTPFGNPVFVDSVARGVVSNVFGREECVVMTDVSLFPGCEGAPVFVVSQRADRNICGMVVAPLSWCREESVNYTFVANLKSCLGEVLKQELSIVKSIVNVKENDQRFNRGVGSVERSIVVVKCGLSWGTGILIDKNTGVFLTCSHVVTEAPGRAVRIVTPSNSKSTFYARLIYRTPENKPYDVAVLKLDPSDVDPSLVSIKLSRTPIRRGEPVLSAGFPFFSSRPTLSGGVVSKSLSCMLQTTCCVQSGASGGPIVRRTIDDEDEMLGMVVCNAMSSDNAIVYPRLSMAIPVSVLVEPLLEYLRTGDSRVLGVFDSHDAIVGRTWNFSALLTSKI